jgi:hypothetical protein
VITTGAALANADVQSFVNGTQVNGCGCFDDVTVKNTLQAFQLQHKA